MAAPRFSLVIPTRHRADKLLYCLQTCLAQDFEDFEVVVSDNFSAPDTRETALSFGDRRIKYFRTPRDLSLTDSMEFALEKAEGEYISMLGDDDGYLLHALTQADALLKSVNASALRWDAVLYSWPDIAPQHYSEPNALILPLRQARGGHVLRSHKSADAIQAAANGHMAYSDLPTIYCGVVRRDLLTRLRERTGRVFRSRTADAYAAFAIAALTDSYYAIDAPMMIAGASGKSTGIARHFSKRGSTIDIEFRRSSEQAGHTWHSIVPDLPPIVASVADAVLYLKESLPEVDVTIDRRQLVNAILRDVVVETDADWREALAVCRRSLTDDETLLAWFDATHDDCSTPRIQLAPQRQASRRYGSSYLALDAAEHGIHDTMGVAQFCEHLFGYRRDGIAVQIQTQTPDPAESLTDLQEKEHVIQQLAKLLREKERQIQSMQEKKFRPLHWDFWRRKRRTH